ncbi:DUF4013 domain-containing protein [Methanosarcina sp. Mfa9]|uniref:DUF4013 domain-containing protein n=1 Tax=Methanosarcina sp. Mfa9 TaxID=3439063 RepID=UPI003F855F57
MQKISFTDALKYPFRKPKRLLYVLWALLPVIGWFALFGYIVRITNEFIEGKYEGLPQLHFMEDLKLGFWMFLKSLPFSIVFCIPIVLVMYYDETTADILNLLLSFFVLPVLTINFYRKQTVGSFFEFSKLKYVMNNLGDYLVVMIKQYALIIVFLVFILFLVGIPALYFASTIFTANFYGRVVEKKTGQFL